jgi:hypothetical protein
MRPKLLVTTFLLLLSGVEMMFTGMMLNLRGLKYPPNPSFTEQPCNNDNDCKDTRCLMLWGTWCCLTEADLKGAAPVQKNWKGWCCCYWR